MNKVDTSENQNSLITGNTLKAVACFSMLIDHIGYVLLDDEYSFRCIGRLAFPLFIFLLIEGFIHTKSKYRYLFRLGIGILLSEIPFDLAFYDTPFYPYSNSVMITLFLGFVCMLLLDNMLSSQRIIPNSGVKHFAKAALLALCIFMGYILHSDYGSFGVAAIIIGYVIRLITNDNRLTYLGICLSLLSCGLIEAWGLLAFPLILLYNGRLGVKNKAFQVFFYLFYPLHLLIIFYIHNFYLGG